MAINPPSVPLLQGTIDPKDPLYHQRVWEIIQDLDNRLTQAENKIKELENET